MGKQYVVQACIRTEYANCLSKRYCTYRSESSSGTQHTYIQYYLQDYARMHMCCTVCAHSRFERWYSPIRTVLATWSWDFSRNLPNIQTYVRTYVHTCRQHTDPLQPPHSVIPRVVTHTNTYGVGTNIDSLGCLDSHWIFVLVTVIEVFTVNWFWFPTLRWEYRNTNYSCTAPCPVEEHTLISHAGMSASTHTRMYVHTYVCTHTYIRMYIRTCAHVHACTHHIYTQLLVCTPHSSSPPCRGRWVKKAWVKGHDVQISNSHSHGCQAHYATLPQTAQSVQFS